MELSVPKSPKAPSGRKWPKKGAVAAVSLMDRTASWSKIVPRSTPFSKPRFVPAIPKGGAGGGGWVVPSGFNRLLISVMANFDRVKLSPAAGVAPQGLENVKVWVAAV